ncbi:MAG: tRNA pseudouridine(54/55) synthase Pus10, partial [Candidatus Bathyarchaeia archaeon]
MTVLEVAKAMLEGYPLCDHCLGRQFALLGHGLSNQERGEAIKLLLTAEGHRLAIEGEDSGRELLKTIAVNGFSEVASQTMRSMGLEVGEAAPSCYLCGGKFDSLGEAAQRIAERLSEYEYQTFLIGVRIPADVEEREDELRAKYNVRWGENIRSGFSREVGKGVSELTGKVADFKRPDILAIINPFTNRISLQVNPLFIAGRYRKLVRGIPQAKWICRECDGRGCPRCGWTGKMYQESVEELIAASIIERTAGVNAKFHAAGREDVDA